MSASRRLLSVKDAAEYLGLGIGMVYRLAEEGRIACVRTDGRVLERRTADGTTERYRKTGRLRFLQADLDAWLDAHRAPATRGPVVERTIASDRPERIEVGVEDLIPKVRRFS